MALILLTLAKPALTSFPYTESKLAASILTSRMPCSTHRPSLLLCKRQSREVPALLVHRRLSASLEARPEAGFCPQRRIVAVTGLEGLTRGEIAVGQPGDVFVALARN